MRGWVRGGSGKEAVGRLLRKEGDGWSRAGCDCRCVTDRDLKLDNTLLSKDNPPLIKLCDFGFARGWGEDSHFTTVIGTPVSLPACCACQAQCAPFSLGVRDRHTGGPDSAPFTLLTVCVPNSYLCAAPYTQDYMAPQITAAKMHQGKALYDGTKADVWAMGVLLCVMLIGKFPFEGESVSTMQCNDPMKKARGGGGTSVFPVAAVCANVHIPFHP